MERFIFHCDMNNFYASVECLYNPALRNVPMAVGGNEEARHGIVLAKNQLAKAAGVKTGDVLWEAKQKCPNIVFVPPQYEKYLRFSRMAQKIYQDYTPKIEAFGLDECWLDLTGTSHLHGTGPEVAESLRERIKLELGITCSIGVSYNKIFAKLGSDMKKPDAVTVITRQNYKEKVWQLAVEELLYVGPATTRKLHGYGVHTIGNLATAEPKLLQQWFGVNGLMLWEFANGMDISTVADFGAGAPVKSIGNSTTAPRDLITDEDIKITMYMLAESVAARLREQGLKCTTLQIYVRANDLQHYERQEKLPFASCTSATIAGAAFELYMQHHCAQPVRSLGVRACNLVPADYSQVSFLDDNIKDEKAEQLEAVVDTLRRRFGHRAVSRALLLYDDIGKINPKADHTIHPVAFLK